MVMCIRLQAGGLNQKEITVLLKLIHGLPEIPTNSQRKRVFRCSQHPSNAVLIGKGSGTVIFFFK